MLVISRAAAAAAPAGGGGGGGGASAASDDVAVAAPRVEEPSTALLLAWFACGNRSLFAAQCLVEVLVELYRGGRTFGELQLALKMATLGRSSSSSSRGARARGSSSESDTGVGDKAEGGEVVVPPLLQAQEEDVLVSWVALVFLTAEELGLAPGDLREQPARTNPQQQQQQPEGQGQGQQAVTLGMYDEGQTLARVAGLQGLVQQSSSGGGGSSPFLVLMQQYTRLVLLTVEVVAAAGLATARPLRPPETVLQPSGYSQAFVSSCNATLLLGDDDEDGADIAVQQQQQGKQAQQDQEPCPARGLAVRLLMAFMGAVLGSQWSLVKFVEAVRVAYDQGLAADELFSQLDEQEFVQSGGLLPIAGTSPPPSPDAAAAIAGPDAATPMATPAPQYQITKALFSTWISLSYMTMAQLAVPYPAAGQRLGWAWAGFGDPVEALGMNDFVANVLRQMAGEDPRVVPLPEQPSQPPQPPQEDQRRVATSDPDAPLAVAPTATSEPGSQVLDPDLDSGSVTGVANVTGGGSRRRDGAHMVRMEDESLPATSIAVRVLTQQVALVQAVCCHVMKDAPEDGSGE
ncbi:hypothetical protein VOLCADRAFT_106518 [Volvox carteri f. nagariensis]|uniref:Uncharacterized protein n=1 Tax=Volvox carteri f. nagariensis TaxID=3068 RepID=D8U820_VOLCA|nr:uncharacterized protein VOLCADRAFT_106518 [Volvox carteri f. nagariensis]EFJ44191.1 hypothetical protein VOLCADRAFT_106518 [Volvox carteri f. nagariensis]|eukprot:XP_002954785.1 hypothetical protein VOLCADRAFT_106518 [Volvox carteri f. nagariensis]